MPVCRRVVLTTDSSTSAAARSSASATTTCFRRWAPLGEAGRPLFGTIDSAGGIVTSRRTAAFERVVALGSRAGSVARFSVQAEKRLGHGATITASYTYTDARDLLSATQGDLDAVVDSTTVGSPLEHSLRPSGWSAPHRVTLLVAADLPLPLALSLFYAGQSGSAFPYTVAGVANADGHINDPIYVPAQPKRRDISLVEEDGPGGPRTRRAPPPIALGSFLRFQSCLARRPDGSMARNSCRTRGGPRPRLASRARSRRAPVADAHPRRLQPAERVQRPLGRARG